ncbi:MAG: hypothetical protein LBU06_02045 [Desulfovibrio sp.]|nr:hypothetical protein [Desulfovibrio sp.]
MKMRMPGIFRFQREIDKQRAETSGFGLIFAYIPHILANAHTAPPTGKSAVLSFLFSSVSFGMRSCSILVRPFPHTRFAGDWRACKLSDFYVVFLVAEHRTKIFSQAGRMPFPEAAPVPA